MRTEYERLRPRLPHIPPSDLLSIIACRLRPFGTGKVFFLRPLEGGGYVF